MGGRRSLSALTGRYGTVKITLAADRASRSLQVEMTDKPHGYDPGSLEATADLPDDAYVYVPPQASFTAAGIALVCVAAILALQFLHVTDPSVAPSPIEYAVAAGLFLLTAIILSMSIGWSYVLTDLELIVRRFGRERRRLVLGQYEGNTAFMGLIWLRFTGHRVWLVSALDPARQAFLAELRLRADHAGATTTPLAPGMDGQRLRLRVADILFPDECVACSVEPTTSAVVRAVRGFDLIYVDFRTELEVAVPVCRRHGRMRTLAGWLRPVVIVPLVVLFTLIIVAILGIGVWKGALLLSLLPAIAIYFMAQDPLSRRLDAAILGLHLTNPSSDLTEVTLHFRESSLLEKVRQNSQIAPNYSLANR